MATSQPCTSRPTDGLVLGGAHAVLAVVPTQLLELDGQRRGPRATRDQREQRRQQPVPLHREVRGEQFSNSGHPGEELVVERQHDGLGVRRDQCEEVLERRLVAPVELLDTHPFLGEFRTQRVPSAELRNRDRAASPTTVSFARAIVF
jgi:hypothetical protein